MSKIGKRVPGHSLLLSLLALLIQSRAIAVDLLPPGFRPLPPGDHALVGGNVLVKPGGPLEAGTVGIRDGLIQAGGKGVSPPADARVWDMKGLTIYAGFIESYRVLAATNPPVSTASTEPIDGSGLTSGV